MSTLISLISFLLIISIIIFSIFGFFIALEYMRYFLRKLKLKLRGKLND